MLVVGIIIILFFTYCAPVFRWVSGFMGAVLVIGGISGSHLGGSVDSWKMGIIGAILFVTALVGELKNVSFDKGDPLFKNKNSPPPTSSKPSQKKSHPSPERTVITKVNYQGSSGPERTIITKVNYKGSEEVARTKRRLQKENKDRIRVNNEEKISAEEREKLSSIRWLREQWESLQHKRAKGYELDDYEMRLEKQYEESTNTD